MRAKTWRIASGLRVERLGGRSADHQPFGISSFRYQLVQDAMFGMLQGSSSRRIARRAVIALSVVLAVGHVDGARAQSVSSLPLPPGQIVSGVVYKPSSACQPPSFVPSITTGADANLYILPSSCTAVPSFVASAAAAMVVTSVPTQYVRFYCPTCSPSSDPNRAFIADPSTVRGLTPAQIKDVLALPAVPTMQTIVLVPAGSCVLVGMGAPAFGGSGGPAQEWIAGTPSGANCFGLQYLPATDYINRQAIGAYALLYGPNAGGGNAGAVAAALDRGPYPVPFTGMDGLYKSLDLLNYGDPAPLRAALVQLGGEVHASVKTVMFGDSLFLREAVLGRLRQGLVAGGGSPMAALAYAGDREAASAVGAADAAVAAPQTMVWAQGVGAWGRIAGDGDAAGVSRNLGGLFAGLDHRFGGNGLAGIAGGYTNSSLSISDRTSSAGIATAHVATYAGASVGPWTLRGAGSASFSAVDASRSIAFTGFVDAAAANYRATTTQAFGEIGYAATFGGVAVEPFAGAAFVHLQTGGFTESGGTGFAALSASGGSDDIGYTTLGSRAATTCDLAYGMLLTLRASAAWQHTVGGLVPTAALAFAANGAPFTVAGVPLARDAALVQAGFDLQVGRQVIVSVAYSGNLSDRAQDNSVRGQLSWRF